MMVRIKIKRVYDPGEPSDGYRILIDRLWPRGVKKGELHHDLWAKEIAPSTPLRQWYHQDMERRWPEFEKRYAEELDASVAMPDFIDKIRRQDTVTLLYASKDTARNHALVLQSYLEKSLSRQK